MAENAAQKSGDEDMVNLGAEDFLTKEEGAQLVVAAEKRIERRLYEKLRPYEDHGKQIGYLRLGIYALGRILGMEAPTTFTDEKETDKEIKKLLGKKYKSVLDKLEYLSGKIDGLEKPAKRGEEGNSDATESKSYDTEDIEELRKEIGELRASMEDGGEIHNAMIEAVREAVKSYLHVEPAESDAHDKKKGKKVKANSNAADVNNLAKLVSELGRTVFRDEPEMQKYLKLSDDEE